MIQVDFCVGLDFAYSGILAVRHAEGQFFILVLNQGSRKR